jgi:hypothetical protein
MDRKHIAVMVAGALAHVVLAGPAVAGEVSGKYVGNGKSAKLTSALVVPHDPWNDEPAYTLVLSEKAPSGSMGADTQAMFGKLGDAITITVTKSGKIIGTQVSHQALKKAGFSTVGTIESEGLKIEDGTLSGGFYTTKEQDFFGDKWELDLKAKAALPAGK